VGNWYWHFKCLALPRGRDAPVNRQTENWDVVSGSLTKIGLGADALLWGLNANYEIYFFR
jgi:hypothetical protein